jgi:hypothetical protein
MRRPLFGASKQETGTTKSKGIRENTEKPKATLASTRGEQVRVILVCAFRGR